MLHRLKFYGNKFYISFSRSTLFIHSQPAYCPMWAELSWAEHTAKYTAATHSAYQMIKLPQFAWHANQSHVSNIYNQVDDVVRLDFGISKGRNSSHNSTFYITNNWNKTNLELWMRFAHIARSFSDGSSVKSLNGSDLWC